MRETIKHNAADNIGMLVGDTPFVYCRGCALVKFIEYCLELLLHKCIGFVFRRRLHRRPSFCSRQVWPHFYEKDIGGVRLAYAGAVHCT